MNIERLTNDLKEVYFAEADPNNWTAADVPVTEMTKQEKADRANEKKDAALTAGLLVKTLQIAELMGALPGKDKRTAAEQREAEELERTFRAAEKEAQEIKARMKERGWIN